MDCAVQKRTICETGFTSYALGIGRQIIALLTHGIVKEDRVPPNEIDEAIRRKVKWESDPQTYTYKGVE